MPRLSPMLLIPALLLLWLAMLLIGGPQSAVDAQILAVLNRPALFPAARILTDLGSWVTLLPLAVLAAIPLLLRGDRLRAFLPLLVILSIRFIVELQKAGFDRARPDPSGRQVAVHSMAFPSGHSANSMSLLLLLALLATATSPRWRAPALVFAVSLAVLVGLSRLVLAVHWPSDVIGGWAFGAAWALLLLRLLGGTSALPRH